jgi:DNA-binding MarR family transcriptional regulator
MERTSEELLELARREWAARWPAEVRRPARVAASFLRAHTLVTGRCNGVLAPFGLTLSRYEALLDVHHAPGGERPFGALALRLEVAPAKVTKLVDALEAAGLVERRRHATDRRALVAAVTPIGRQVAERATAALTAIGFGLEPLGDPELDELLTLTRALRGRPEAA